MSYSLSFSEEFFTDETFPETLPAKRPRNVYQAIVSLSKAEKVAIARDVLESKHPVLYVMTDSFASDVLDKVRKTDTCSNLDTPVSVWIDPEGWFTVDVY